VGGLGTKKTQDGGRAKPATQRPLLEKERIGEGEKKKIGKGVPGGRGGGVFGFEFNPIEMFLEILDMPNFCVIDGGNEKVTWGKIMGGGGRRNNRVQRDGGGG